MIVSINEGGLSNRIKSLVSCIRYSKKYNKNCKVYWKILDSYRTNNHILNCKFSKLFKNDIEVHDLECLNNKETFNSHCLKIEDDDNLPIGFNTFQSKCPRSFVSTDKLKRNIDFMYNKIPNKIKQDYIKAFQELSAHNKCIPEKTG